MQDSNTVLSTGAVASPPALQGDRRQDLVDAKGMLQRVNTTGMLTVTYLNVQDKAFLLHLPESLSAHLC